jgi:hypothetical protein
MIDNSLVKIIKSDKKSQNKFYNLIKKISKLSKKYPIFMGIDFEFNTKKIALMQILFEIHKKEKIIKKYYIVFPPNFELEIYEFFKINIMANTSILKILHGSESLDIPYLVEIFFDMDIELGVDFFLSMIDTRYLCEYLNIESSDKQNICRIYDLLEKTQIISAQEKLLLETNEIKMGPIYEIFIDINTLTPELITYSIHDVVYLIDLFQNLKTQIIKTNPKNYYLLIDAQRYCFMEKRNVTNIGDDLILINQMNNYFYYINKSNTKTEYILDKLNIYTPPDKTDFYHRISMIKTHEIMMKDFLDSFDGPRFIISINYLKSNLSNLLKTITYAIILKNYRVKATKIDIVDYDLESNIKEIIQGLKALDLNHLLDLINKFYDYVEMKLKP